MNRRVIQATGIVLITFCPVIALLDMNLSLLGTSFVAEMIVVGIILLVIATVWNKL